MSRLTFLVVLVALLECSQCASVEYAPIVHLKNGALRGLALDVENGGKAYFYQGIHYGKAVRFSKPTPAGPWEGVYNATEYQFACVQSRYPIQDHVNRHRGMATGSSNEDCLYLNLFRPASQPTSPRAVMVFFYGGSFSGGTIFDMVYDARILANQGDVIVITVNYRLGPFGFLYAGTEDAPGNGGLYDQLLALKWVQENIGAFGGDPAKTTIFGQSAGSMSVGALILSPLSKGLFHRAIMQSGVPNSYFGSDKPAAALEKAKILGEKLNCTTANMSDMVKCLRSKSAKEIEDNTGDAMANGESFVPTYETEFMPLRPVEALKTGKFNHVDMMYGVTRDEGTGFIARLLPMLDPDNDGHDLKISSVKALIKIMFQMFKEPHYQEVADYYTKNLNESDKKQLRQAASQSFADYHLVCPTILFGEAAARAAPKNRYYSYRVMVPTSIGLMGCKKSHGVCHGEDMIYVMGISQRLRGIVFTETEYVLSKDMIKSWTNFVKYGKPGKVGSVEWTDAVEYGLQSEYTKHMALDPANYEMINDFYKVVCNGFWKSKIFT